MIVISYRKILKCAALSVALMLLSIAAMFAFMPTAKAEEYDFSVTAKCDSDYVYTYKGDWYVSSGSSGKIKINYTLRNNSDKTVRFSAIKVEETILDDYGQYKYGGNTFDSGMISIAPGEDYNISGSAFVCSGSSGYTFLYDILAVPYEADEYGIALPFTSSDYVSIIDGGDVLFISSERISLNIDYDYRAYRDNIYLNDRITVTATVSSLCNIPLQNVEIYDSVYGLLGSISSIRPGESIRIDKDVNVTGSGKSYPYIEYSVINRDKRESISFEDKAFEIKITDFTYELSVDIEPETWYISDGDEVTFDFTVSNIGSGLVENIVIFDIENQPIIEIPAIASGAFYECQRTFACSPGIDYVFRCISPLTEDQENHIELLLVPDVSVSCTLNKKPSEYSFQDKVEVTYTVRNNGSVDAYSLVLIDVGTNQTWEVGALPSGMTRTASFTVTLLNEKTVFSPMLTGIYDDETETPINESASPIVVEVELPSKYVELQFSSTLSRQIINEGDDVLFTFNISNIGNATFKSYTVRLVELNEIIACEGALEPSSKAVFTKTLTMHAGQTVTVSFAGVNADTGKNVAFEYPLDIVVHELIDKPTPTPVPSSTVLPTKDPSETPTVIDDKKVTSEIIRFFIYLVIGIVALIVIVTVIYSVSIALKIRRKKKDNGLK